MPTETSNAITLPQIRNWRPIGRDQSQLASTPVLSGLTQGSVKTPDPRQPGLDRATRFALAAQQRVNGALLRCEEKFPSTGHHSVLYMVVESNAAIFQESLTSLHQEFFGPDQQDPLAPVRLQIVDRAADETLQRLSEAGLIRWTSRISRPIWPAKGAGEQAALSSAEAEKADAHRHVAAHRLKIAAVLNNSGFPADARSALLEAMLALARALAVEQRLPEPHALCESLLPPFSESWGKDLPLFRRFAADAGDSCTTVLQALMEVGR